MTSNASASKVRLVEIMLFLTAVIWGLNPPVIKLALQYVPPQPYNVARMLVACLVAVVALVFSGTYRPVSRDDFIKLARISAFGFLIFQLFYTEGIQRTTSGNAAFILCLMPVTVLLINRFFGLEKITRPVVFGICFSISGVLLIVIGTGKELSLAQDHLFGILLLLVSQAGYAYYTVYSKELLARYSTYQVTTYLMLLTTAMLALASAPKIAGVDWLSVPAVAWSSVLFSGVFGLCIGNFLWIWGTGVIGSSRAAIFNNLSPVFAVVAGYFMLGESFGMLQGVGAICVFAGINITRLRDRFA